MKIFSLTGLFLCFLPASAINPAVTGDSHASPGNMTMIQQGCFKIYYSPGSLSIAEQLMALTQRSYPVFKGYFNADRDLCLNIYWADRNDWPYVPENRSPDSYGMPHMSEGTNHTHTVILPAANIDMPERLINIIDPLLDINKLGNQESADMKSWLGMSPGTTDQELRSYLSSSPFYVDYLVNIVYIHEMMHDFSMDFGIPENHNHNGHGKAWWVFEGLAQWSVLWINRDINNNNWADIHDLFYRWMYRTGKTQPGNVGPNEYANYAWFHGVLVEMFHQLEIDYGKVYWPAVLNQILACISGRYYLNDREMVSIFSTLANDDLGQWFKNNWGIGDGTIRKISGVRE